MTEGLRIREGVRALVVDPDDRVLLVRWELPGPDGPVHVWGAPGGGVEADEDLETALRREVDEELGFDPVTIGPLVWVRTHIVPFISGLWDGQHDHFFLVRTDAFEPKPLLTREQLAAEHLMEIRWWTPDELAAVRTVRHRVLRPPPTRHPARRAAARRPARDTGGHRTLTTTRPWRGVDVTTPPPARQDDGRD